MRFVNCSASGSHPRTSWSSSAIGGAEADGVLETLRACGLPAHADVSSAIEAAPAVSALRLAIRLPLEDWETELIVSLLRHGQSRSLLAGAGRRLLATAARSIKATFVFRGRGQLLMTWTGLSMLGDGRKG